ncbi:MAG TPA: M23 family metallopeptidase [Vulgatibacter sp.]|nr:M23 family metallopeptidase [Vulgatibacter sp.]
MNRFLLLGLAAFAALAPWGCATPQTARESPESSSIDAVVVHPIFASWVLTNEHWAGQLGELGDALGSDVFVAELVEEGGRSWLRTYRGDGSRNEDWFGWRREVLAPIAGEVVRVHLNPITNEPGSWTPGMATFLILRGDDDTHVLVAHLREIVVQEGARVEVGQPLGLVGNNGNSRHPHIHLGAWRGDQPLQIRFDLAAMAKLREAGARAE